MARAARTPRDLRVIHVAAYQGCHGGWSPLDEDCPHLQILGGKYSEFCGCENWQIAAQGGSLVGEGYRLGKSIDWPSKADQR